MPLKQYHRRSVVTMFHIFSSYEWLKNGHILQFPSLQGNLHQINEGTILIKPLTSLDEGYYQCTAWNQFGRTMSNVTNLRRAIFDQPSPNINIFESDWIEEGMPYMLQCLQTKFYPKPTYSWAITKERIDETQVPIPTGKRIQIDEQGETSPRKYNRLRLGNVIHGIQWFYQHQSSEVWSSCLKHCLVWTGTFVARLLWNCLVKEHHPGW